MGKLEDRLALYQEVFPKCCVRETSADPDGWTEDNPLWGHCAVVALFVQAMFGGKILRASLEGTKFVAMRSHYWNRLPDGREVDFTEPQFGPIAPILKGVPRDREEILSHPETRQRYMLLAEMVATVLHVRFS